MLKLGFVKNKFFLATLLIDAILIIIIAYLMSYVQTLIIKDARINLTEIVMQNKDVIASRLSVEINNIELDAKQLAHRLKQTKDTDYEERKEIFLSYIRETNNTTLMFADKNGVSINSRGDEINIKARNYFKLALRDVSNISERIVSRLNGEDIFIICTPIKYNNQIIGTLQKQYTPQEMYNLCSVALFSSDSASYIINKDGYILIFSQQDSLNRESDNYYRILYLTNSEAAKKLEADIANRQSGFMNTVIDGKEMFSAYTPIDQVHDWYLISSVNTNAVSPNSKVVIKLFYGVLSIVVFFFTFSMFYYMVQKRKEKDNLERVAFVDVITLGNTYTKFLYDIPPLFKANQNTTFHMCAFNIDNFKFINSFYGFEVGDRILREVYQLYAKKLSGNERIARVHSDHFVMLLEDISEQRLKDLVKDEYRFGDIIIYISTGLYKIQDTNESINLMRDKANMAVQKIKGMRHSNIAVYSDNFDKELTRNEQIKRAIEVALEEDEIIPFFQPKVDLYTREVVGAEALARWRTKDGKMISPGEFIPVCEKSGLITLVDMAIFEKTLAFIKSNLDKGIKCSPISVNFSRMHLLNKNFLEIILDKIHKYNVPTELLELELTETIIFDNSESINTFINNLHKHGLKISMDDFGSGYSSLHMLKDIEIDILKIDRGFLLDTSSPERQKAIFSTIVELATKLNIKVVVEGVETEENLQLAKEFGCSIIQGYYFARPMDKDDFEKIYQAGII